LATSTFVRPGQIAAHARAGGLTPLATDLFFRKRGRNESAVPNAEPEGSVMPLIHAFQIRHLPGEADFAGGITLAKAPLPKPWLVLLRRWTRQFGLNLVENEVPIAGIGEYFQKNLYSRQ
jgi:hypothetical protein